MCSFGLSLFWAVVVVLFFNGFFFSRVMVNVPFYCPISAARPTSPPVSSSTAGFDFSLDFSPPGYHLGSESLLPPLESDHWDGIVYREVRINPLFPSIF